MMMMMMVVPIRARGCWRWEVPARHCFATACFPFSLNSTHDDVMVKMNCNGDNDTFNAIMMIMAMKTDGYNHTPKLQV